MYCKKCGKEINDEAVICVHCGVATGYSGVGAVDTTVAGHGAGNARASDVPKDRMTFVLLGAFLGALGAHNFYAGYVGKGVAQLLVTLILGVLIFPSLAMWIWAVVEICTIRQDARGIPFATR